MKEEEIKEILEEIKAYLKDNLRVEVETTQTDYYGRGLDNIEIKLFLNKEEIYRTSDRL